MFYTLYHNCKCLTYKIKNSKVQYRGGRSTYMKAYFFYTRMQHGCEEEHHAVISDCQIEGYRLEGC